MLCKCYRIVLYTVHVIEFSVLGPFFYGDGVVTDDDSSALLVTSTLCQRHLVNVRKRKRNS